MKFDLNKRLPVLTWLPKYSWGFFLQDVLAGLTVGMTEIPQGIAYATIAGLPPEYGLYSGLLDGFIYAILGGCKDVNIGPSALLSLMVQPVVAKGGISGCILMTFMSGLTVLILSIFQLGFLIHFFSYPVLTGFVTGGVTQIALGQFVSLLGISGNTATFLDTCKTLIGQIAEARLWDCILGISTIVLLFSLKAIGRFGSLEERPYWSKSRNFFAKIIFMVVLARNAIALITGTTLAYIFAEENLFKVAGNISGRFPALRTPNFSIFDSLPISSFLIPLISILEVLTIAKIFSKAKKIDPTQEMLAMGLCNFLGSFLGSLPVTGSFSRSTVNHISGVKSQMAGIFSSLLLLLTIATLTSTFQYVPKTTLAAILISAMYSLLDFEAPGLLWKTKKLDFGLFIVTTVACLFVSIEMGVLIGAGLNLLVVLYAHARPKIDVTVQDDVTVVTPRDTLHFPAAEFLRDTVIKSGGSTIVINGKYIRNIDATIAKCFATFSNELLARKQKLSLVNFKPAIIRICVQVDKSIEAFFKTEISDVSVNCF